MLIKEKTPAYSHFISSPVLNHGLKDIMPSSGSTITGFLSWLFKVTFMNYDGSLLALRSQCELSAIKGWLGQSILLTYADALACHA